MGDMLAIRDEVVDLEKAGAVIIQIDEAALGRLAAEAGWVSKPILLFPPEDRPQHS